MVERSDADAESLTAWSPEPTISVNVVGWLIEVRSCQTDGSVSHLPERITRSFGASSCQRHMKFAVTVMHGDLASGHDPNLVGHELWDNDVQTISVDVGNAASAAHKLVATFRKRYTEDEFAIKLFNRPLKRNNVLRGLRHNNRFYRSHRADRRAAGASTPRAVPARDSRVQGRSVRRVEEEHTVTTWTQRGGTALRRSSARLWR
jgi:hypothetical protein